jgi:hypothetical protein
VAVVLVVRPVVRPDLDLNLGLDPARQLALFHLGGDARLRGAVLDQVRGVRGPERSQAAEVIERLQDVGLALPVVSEEHGQARPGIEVQLQRRQVPPAGRAQATDPHGIDLVITASWA